jgi:hypothetical protein
MLPINNFYTGQGTGLVAPELGRTEAANIRAQEKQSDIYKMKFNEALRQRKEMLEAGEIDVVDLMVEKQSKIQSEKIAEFEDYIKKLYADRKGELSVTDLLDLKSRRNQLKSFQNQAIASQESYLKDEAEFRKKPYDYDAEAWNASRGRFYETGKYEAGGLKLRPIDTKAAFLTALRDKGSPIQIRKDITEFGDASSPEGKSVKTTEIIDLNLNSVGDQNRLKEMSTTQMFVNGRLAETRADKFLQLPQEEQERYQRMADEDPLLGNAILAYGYEEDYQTVDEWIKRTGKKATGEGSLGRRRDGGYGTKDEAYTRQGVITGAIWNDGKNGWTVVNNRNRLQPIAAHSVLQAEPGVDVSGLDKIDAVPVNIAQDHVEWEVKNTTRILKWEVDGEGFPIERRMTEEEADEYAKNRSLRAEMIDVKKGFFEGGNVVIGVTPKYRYKFASVPPTFRVLSTRADYHQQLKFYAGDDYDVVMGWDKPVSDAPAKIDYNKLKIK